ncbi:AarF/UbiB family protein [Algiphilus sp.]|uniref:AarF/UbiB family protein n=1 Tax=Algiphilus sp. TaxID=1872431 RepID=UPI003B5180D7
MTEKRQNPPSKRPGGIAILGELGSLTVQTYRLSRAFSPLVRLLAHEHDITRDELTAAVDTVFEGLYAHPATRSIERITDYLRARKMIPDEQSTEDLIRFVVDQMLQRSPVPVPQALVDEFWQFFEELFSSEEIKGLGEMTLDMVRLVIATYEPLLTEVVNILKAGRRFNQWQLQELLRRAQTVRGDITIVRRQLRALRWVRPFFQADPRDFRQQAQIVANMVREFGPFFIKMAQVAAANADFLPNEIAHELQVFHEDVPPMSAQEVEQAFLECFGKHPSDLYMGFDAEKPLRSGSIGSVYLAKKPFVENGVEVLRPIIVKVGRHNIDREFAIGKLVIGLAIISSQYWAPHSKLAPFLRALQEQVDEFVAGFLQELDFEDEAQNQLRFYDRAQSSSVWRVPALYGSSRRILEMEFLADGESLMRALRRQTPAARRRFRAQVAERLLYTILHHAMVYREMHGDLHPGNIMIGSDNALYLIDWGNTVPLDGKWDAVWDYVSGACLADVDLLTDTLIRISTAPEANAKRRQEIRSLLAETLAKRDIKPLSTRNLVSELRRGGYDGLRRRGQAILHLMSNTQHLGLVVRSDYTHLSRALMAAAGSFGSLYEGVPKRTLVRDLLSGVLRLPLLYSRDRIRNEVIDLRRRLAFQPAARPAALPAPERRPDPGPRLPGAR